MAFRKTHCKNGHLLVEGNLYASHKRYRACKTCALAQQKKRRQEQPEAVAAITKRKSLKALGWSLEEYEAAKIEQNNLCALCGEPEPTGVLRADHKHTTGKKRALLCHKCNSGLGLFNDNPSLLELAAAYLQRY